MVQQEFGGVTHPDRFDQALEVFVVELGEGLSAGREHSQRRVEHRGDVLARQQRRNKHSVHITRIVLSRNMREEGEIRSEWREEGEIHAVEDTGRQKTNICNEDG